MSARQRAHAEGQHHCVAVGDYDGDGDEDIYVGTKFQPNSLYRNNGDMTFTNVAEEAGVADEGFTNAAIWFDFDNDGDLDLATGNGFGGSDPEPNRFFVNQGNGTFVDMAEDYGLNSALMCRSLHAADYNHDGFTDLYVVNINAVNHFYRNEGGRVSQTFMAPQAPLTRASAWEAFSSTTTTTETKTFT